MSVEDLNEPPSGKTMQRLITQIGRSQRLKVLNELKRAPAGLAVKALAGHLGMSYMGVKQICLSLERQGYLNTFRNHRGVGRPELLYRLTPKAHDLFPQADNALALSLLNQARTLYGPGAPEKILFLHFQERTKDYISRLPEGSIAERVKELARLRDKEGYLSECANEPTLRIIERHHPMLAVFQALPQAVEMERAMFQKLLGTSVRREQTGGEGTYECVFFVGST